MKKKYLLIALLVLLAVSAFGMVMMNSQPLKQSADKIEIKDGNTGQEYRINDEKKASALEKLSAVEVKTSGVSFWTSGYTYKITFIKNGSSQEILIQTPTKIKSGLFVYETDADVVKIIKEIIGE